MEPVSCLTDVTALWCYNTVCPCPVCRFAWMVFIHFAHKHHSKLIIFFVCNYKSLMRSFGSQLSSEFFTGLLPVLLYVCYLHSCGLSTTFMWRCVICFAPQYIFGGGGKFCTFPIFQNFFFDIIPHFFCHLAAPLSENMWCFHCISSANTWSSCS